MFYRSYPALTAHARPEAVAAPVAAGDAVGHVTVTVDGRAVARIPVVAGEDVAAKAGWLGRIWSNWIGKRTTED